MNTMTGKGYLKIWATEAGGTLPVRGVPVQIRNEAGDLLHVLRTGEGGLTPTVTLSAPAAAGSLQPDSAVRPYAAYRVSVEMNGYQPILEMIVPVFDGITSLQPVALLPATAEEPAGMVPPYLVYPQIPYAGLQGGREAQTDPKDGRRPIGNPPASEDIPNFVQGEMFLDDNDLPDYGRETQ